MDHELLGWPEDEPAIRLDYRAFSYAGKFATGNAGVAVLRVADRGSVAPGWEPDPSLPDPAPRPEEGESGGSAELAEDVIAAVAFNADRTEPGTLWIRYVSVHAARRGEGHAPQLVAFLVDRACDRGYDRLRIGVNNPFAYEALYKVGFAFTGRETGVAELVLERPTTEPADRDPETYRSGLDVYRDRERGDPEASFLEARVGADPPALVSEV
jgi:GNAT superfamily N-acetyltransferase